MNTRKKSVLIIGAGRFGRYLALKFAELGNEVMVVDQCEERISGLISSVTSAEIGDCTNVEVLRSFGVANFDICFVCMGANFQSSIEITYQLKELGAPYVIAKTNREMHEKFLLRNGADEVVYPEKESANKAAVRLSADNVFDYIELTSEYCIFEIPPLASWVGKTIAQVAVRVKYKINILATKENEQVFPLPGADHVFNKEEHLIVAGNRVDIMNLLKRF
ncbi:trk system potassium uptake protein TrkA [Natronincola peptidivorans]|uniref:Trk system potassium uptake protein TrkA n=1 Tax=Natronincola peptidivorans TaxID=426128 RepID=A0A1H9Y4U2_9FIRM|nr:TrkA family potassium uptake protein [Natronincola peptidivorans]SES63730.1 trk system potassium uptake protein TrkA [Natronincola peptidivorans]